MMLVTDWFIDYTFISGCLFGLGIAGIIWTIVSKRG